MQPAAAQMGNWMKNSPGYQFLLVFLLSLNFGIVFFDRQALNALMPFVQPELALSDTQIGLLAGGLSFSWAIAAFFVGKLSDSLGKRKILLIAATVGFSLCSFLSGIATTFVFLFAARLLMGAAEGGVMPISHAMVASEVDPARRGLAQGVAQNLGSNLLGSFLAPVVLVWFATQYSWRDAFYLAAVPGLLSAALIWFLLREPEQPKPLADVFSDSPADAAPETMTIVNALQNRNMWVCVVVGVLMVAHFVITWAFMPNYLVQTKGFDPTTMSWVMGSLGIAAAIYSIVISGLSDIIGRKPVMVVLPFLSVLGPLGAMYFDGPVAGLAAIFFIGWAVNGIFPIFMATIPSETFRPIHHATVLGLAMGSCEVLGGVFGPVVAGALNDAVGKDSFLWLMMGLAIVSGFVAMGLKETAPAVLKRRGIAAVEGDMNDPVLAELIGNLRQTGLDLCDPPEKLRLEYDAMFASFGAAPDLTITGVETGGVPGLRVSTPGSGNCLMLYLHGGGYVLGDAQSYRSLAGEVARAAGMDALVPEYRLAPEHKFPAAVDDALAAYRGLLDDGRAPAEIVIAGDSAGGGLALALLVALRDAGDPLPAAALLISPWADLTGTAGSLETKRAEDCSLTREGLAACAAHYLGQQDRAHPLASPALADLSGLPPLLVQVGSIEILLDDAIAIAARAGAAGTHVTLEVCPGLPHVFHAFHFMLPAAKAALDRAGAFLKASAGGH